MLLTDLNRHGGIGANCHYVEIGPFKLVIDAGVHPKMLGKESTPAYEKVPDFSIDAVILTHCHLDHLGAIPLVMRHQPQARLFMSVPSQIIAGRMLHNSVNVMLRQKAEHGIVEYPLYTHSEVERISRQVQPMPYEKTRYLDKGEDELAITFYPSGHVPGAVGVEFVYHHRRIFFTGDVLFEDQKYLPGACFPRRQVDTLIMETTRGRHGREKDSSRETELTRLFSTIGKTLANSGSVLIPVFALGRMQELVCLLYEARRNGHIPQKCPIYASGLGLDLCDYFDEITRKTGALNFRKGLLKELKVKRMPDVVAGKDPQEGAIYIVSSGMMVPNTPSYFACAALLEHARNTVCFVGYCDPDTPGGELQATAHGDAFLFEALDYICNINASVERFDLSAHADRDALLEYALAVSPRSIVLTHGDEEARQWFADQFAECLPAATVHNLTPMEPREV